MRIDLSKVYKIDATVELRVDLASAEAKRLMQAKDCGVRVTLANPEIYGEYAVVGSFSEAHPERAIACFTLRLFK